MKKTYTYTDSTVCITGRKLLQCGKCTMDLTDGALREPVGNTFDPKASYKPTDTRIWSLLYSYDQEVMNTEMKR